MADNASSLLIDDRLGYGSLGLRQPSPEMKDEPDEIAGAGVGLQLGYKFPGSEGDRSYSQANTPLRRYHGAAAGSVSRSSVAVTIDALVDSNDGGTGASSSRTTAGAEPGEAAVWSLIRAAWPLQRALYRPKPSNGTAMTPSISDAREAVAATVAASVFEAPTGEIRIAALHSWRCTFMFPL